MRYILRTCAGREHYVDYVKKCIPSVEVCFDDVGGAMQNWIKSLEMAGNDAHVNIEDDIWITQNFEKKIMLAINQKPEEIIQFFSMRKADLSIGSRWDNKFCMSQCTYFPEKINKGIIAFSKKYEKTNHESHPYDTMVSDYLKKIKRKYWIHVPSLVDHRVGKSEINPRRASTNRQSFTFLDKDLGL